MFALWLLIFLIAVIIVVFAIILFTHYKTSKIAAPFFPTPKKLIKDALLAAGLKEREKFYDLGSGTGRVALIAKKGFGANAVGLELSFLFYIVSRLRFLFRESPPKILWRNFYNYDLSDADVVFCFLLPRAFGKLEDKFKKELKPGARVISYIFPLEFKTPEKIVGTDLTKKFFIYNY